jgi:hypothetical protein
MVKDLAARLRGAASVDVALDEWEVRPGDQLPHFMERSIRDADFVLCICTPRYKERFDARQGGAGYEAFRGFQTISRSLMKYWQS